MSNSIPGVSTPLGEELVGLFGRTGLGLVLGPVTGTHVLGGVLAHEPGPEGLEFDSGHRPHMQVVHAAS